MQQHFAPVFTATPHGITMDGMPLNKSASRHLSPETLRYIKRAEELLATVKKGDWDNRVPHSTHEVPTLVKAQMLLALASPQPFSSSLDRQNWQELTKDASDDSDDEEDDDSENDSGSSDSSDDASYSGGGHYNPDEPRIPAGQPGGGQWTTGDGTTTDSGSISVDNARTTPNAAPSSAREYQVADSGQIMTDANVGNGSGNMTPNAVAAAQAAASTAQNAASAAGDSASSGQQDSDDQTVSHILDNPKQYVGYSYPNAKGNTECVAFAQQVGGAPVTSEWEPGDYISPSNPPPVGTWVATFNANDNYSGHVEAFSHFGDDGTLYLYDQFNSKGEVTEQPYSPKSPGWSGRVSNNPANYRIVKW